MGLTCIIGMNQQPARRDVQADNHDWLSVPARQSRIETWELINCFVDALLVSSGSSAWNTKSGS